MKLLCQNLIVAVALFVAACSANNASQLPAIGATVTAGTAVTQTATATSTRFAPSQRPIPATSPTLASPIVTPTAVNLPTSPSSSSTAVQAQVDVASLVLRSGPSTIHSKLALYAQGTNVTVLAKAHGDDWVLVKTSDGQTGWMAIVFLSPFDLTTLAIDQPADSLTISGKVVDTLGASIDKIDIAVWQDTPGGQLRTDANSGNDGVFYAYLPQGSQGNWNVGVVGLNCKSRIMDTNCKYSGEFITSTLLVQLPQTQPVTFVYDPNKR